jgi:hypothetical protein
MPFNLAIYLYITLALKITRHSQPSVDN